MLAGLAIAASGCMTQTWRTHAARLEVEGWRFDGDPTSPQRRTAAATLVGDRIVTTAAAVRRGITVQGRTTEGKQGATNRVLRVDAARGIAVLKGDPALGQDLPTFTPVGGILEGASVVVGPIGGADTKPGVAWVRRVVDRVSPGWVLIEGNLDAAAIGGPVIDSMGRLLGVLEDIVGVDGRTHGIVLPAWELDKVMNSPAAAGAPKDGTTLQEFYSGGRELAERCPVRHERSGCVDSRGRRELRIEMLEDADYSIRLDGVVGAMRVTLGGIRRDLPGRDRLAGAFLFTAPADRVLTGEIENLSDDEQCFTLSICRVEW